MYQTPCQLLQCSGECREELKSECALSGWDHGRCAAALPPAAGARRWRPPLAPGWGD